MSSKYIYWYLNFVSSINSTTIKKILKTTTYIALFTIVFITSWAVPQEEASANSNWQCNDAYAREYFYKRLEKHLDEAGFLYPEELAPTICRNLRAMFNKATLTNQEIRTLHGIVTALSNYTPGRK